MYVNMRHSLSTLLSIINNDSVSFVQVHFFSYLSSSNQELSQNFLMLFLCCRKTCQSIFIFWNNQNMNGCLRRDIFESKYIIVFKDYICWYFLINDFIKDSTHEECCKKDTINEIICKIRSFFVNNIEYNIWANSQIYNKIMLDIKINSIPPNSLKELDEEKWEVVKTIYQGNYCDVKQVTYKKINYALKVIELQRISVDNYQFQYRRIYNEIKVLYMTNHKNIIKLLWHKQCQTKIYLLFELFGIKLSKYLKKNKLNEEDIKIIARQLAQGLNHLHIKGLIHRDISTDNILIDQELNIKIIDFGYSNQLAGRRQTQLGTLLYAAPQVLKNQSYNHKADIWSFGIVLYQLFHHKTPFCPSKDTSEQQIEKNRNNLNYKFDANAPPLYVNLIKSILVHDPQKRPDLDEVLKGPWLRIQQQQNEDFQFNDYQSEQDRKTSKMQHSSNQPQYSLKQMPIKQLQAMLINLTKMHSKQLIKKRDLLKQLIQTEVKLCSLTINNLEK